MKLKYKLNIQCFGGLGLEATAFEMMSRANDYDLLRKLDMDSAMNVDYQDMAEYMAWVGEQQLNRGWTQNQVEDALNSYGGRMKLDGTKLYQMYSDFMANTKPTYLHTTENGDGKGGSKKDAILNDRLFTIHANSMTPAGPAQFGKYEREVTGLDQAGQVKGSVGKQTKAWGTSGKPTAYADTNTGNINSGSVSYGGKNSKSYKEKRDTAADLSKQLGNKGHNENKSRDKSKRNKL